MSPQCGDASSARAKRRAIAECLIRGLLHDHSGTVMAKSPDPNAVPSTAFQFVMWVGNMLPMWARVCLLSILTLGSWVAATGHMTAVFPGFATRDEVTSAISSSNQHLGAQVATVETQVTQESARARSRYSEQLDDELLDDAAKCQDSRSHDTNALYAREIASIVEEYRRNNNGQDPPSVVAGACR